jgi:hypothetical protein
VRCTSGIVGYSRDLSQQAPVIPSAGQGKIADLVLLDANLPVEISNTTKITAVVFEGDCS